MKKHNTESPVYQKGFSLVELLVVIFIVITISTVVLVQYTNFNSQSRLNIIAQEIAVTIRQAQVFGIAVRGETDDGVNYQFPNYGIYAERTNNPNQIILFSDLDGTPGFSTDDAIVEVYTIPTPYVLSNICIDEDGIDGGELCSDGDDLNEVNILFKRPESEPTINSKFADDSVIDDVVWVRFYLEDFTGADTRRIEVWNTGQISVHND